MGRTRKSMCVVCAVRVWNFNDFPRLRLALPAWALAPWFQGCAFLCHECARAYSREIYEVTRSSFGILPTDRAIAWAARRTRRFVEDKEGPMPRVKGPRCVVCHAEARDDVHGADGMGLRCRRLFDRFCTSRGERLPGLKVWPTTPDVMRWAARRARRFLAAARGR